MKKLIFLILLTGIIGCYKDNQREKFFNTAKLNELNVNNLSVFFGVEKPSLYAGPFKNFVGYIDGIGYENSEKSIFVSVFASQEKAIECMENRINTVACVIKVGDSDIFHKNKWWFSECIPNIFFVNQWNTIIEVSYYHNSYENVKDILIITANELAQRVDSLSETIN